MAILSNTPPAETQLQRRHHLSHRDAANAATEDMTQDGQSKIVHKTGRSKNEEQPAIGCKCGHIEVHGRQLMIQHTTVVPRELPDRSIAARNGKPPRSTKAFVNTVREIENLMLSAVGFSQTNLVIRIPKSGPNKRYRH